MNRVVILAAGSGSRLISASFGTPKSLIDLGRGSLFELNLHNLQEVGVEANEITVVLGYDPSSFAPVIGACNVLENPDWSNTSQVESLRIALEKCSSGPQLVLYGDVFHDSDALAKYLEAIDKAFVGSFTGWRQSWAERYDNPLEDLEKFHTFEGDGCKKLVEIGGKPQEIEAVQGQFSGAFSVTSELRDFIRKHCTCKCATSVTALLSHYLALGGNLNVVEIAGPWFEIDTPRDLLYARRLLQDIFG